MKKNTGYPVKDIQLIELVDVNSKFRMFQLPDYVKKVRKVKVNDVDIVPKTIRANGIVYLDVSEFHKTNHERYVQNIKVWIERK